MPVPEEVKANSHVFCYSSDLVDASNKLASYLNCKVSKVYSGDFDPQAYKSKTAWLVGHGAVTNTIVGNQTGDFGYKIRSICDWLKEYGYGILVDTCCYPNTRKRWQTFTPNYFCTNDNECVMVITSYGSFDEWWDSSHMHQHV